MPLFSHGSRRTSGTSCGRSQHPAWTSQLPPAPGRNSHLSSLCGEGLGGTSHGDGTCPHRQRMSIQGHKITLGKKTPFPPCRGILPRQLPWPAWPHRGHPTRPAPEESFRGLCSGTGSTEPPATALRVSATLTPYSPIVLDLVNSSDHPLGCFGAVCWSPRLPGGPSPCISPSGGLSRSPAKKRAL